MRQPVTRATPRVRQRSYVACAPSFETDCGCVLERGLSRRRRDQVQHSSAHVEDVSVNASRRSWLNFGFLTRAGREMSSHTHQLKSASHSSHRSPRIVQLLLVHLSLITDCCSDSFCITAHYSKKSGAVDSSTHLVRLLESRAQITAQLHALQDKALLRSLQDQALKLCMC